MEPGCAGPVQHVRHPRAAASGFAILGIRPAGASSHHQAQLLGGEHQWPVGGWHGCWDVIHATHRRFISLGAALPSRNVSVRHHGCHPESVLLGRRSRVWGAGCRSRRSLQLPTSQRNRRPMGLGVRQRLPCRHMPAFHLALSHHRCLPIPVTWSVICVQACAIAANATLMCWGESRRCRPAAIKLLQRHL